MVSPLKTDSEPFEIHASGAPDSHPEHDHSTDFKHAPEECWKCGTRSAESLFCQFCNSLQKPQLDYYRFFGMKRKLSIVPEELQKRFYSLSRLLHPDRYTQKPPTEQQHSLEATAILNDAYRILRDPVLRAEYLLKKKGFEATEPRSKNVDPRTA